GTSDRLYELLVFYEVFRKQECFRGEIVCALQIASILRCLLLLYVFANLAHAVLLGGVEMARGNLLQVGVSRHQHLRRVLSLIRSLLFAHGWRDFQSRVGGAAIVHYLFVGRSSIGLRWEAPVPLPCRHFAGCGGRAACRAGFRGISVLLSSRSLYW